MNNESKYDVEYNVLTSIKDQLDLMWHLEEVELCEREALRDTSPSTREAYNGIIGEL